MRAEQLTAHTEALACIVMSIFKWSINNSYSGQLVWTERAWGRLISQWLSDIPGIRKRLGGREGAVEEIAITSILGWKNYFYIPLFNLQCPLGKMNHTEEIKVLFALFTL